MALQSCFLKFNEKIYLTGKSDGYKKAKEKDDSICEEIKTAFKNKGYPVIDTFKQGSFKVKTAIKSLDGDYDIDRAIVINESDAPDDPIAPKKIIKEVLEKRNFKDPKIKKPCVTADYKSLNLHIDYTVYKQDIVDRYYLAVGKQNSSNENKEWSECDQKGLIDWIDSIEDYSNNAEQKRYQFKRFIRYMKRWRDVQFSSEVKKKIFSIGLTIMIKTQYTEKYSSCEIPNDLEALKTIVDSILDNYFIDNGNEKYRISVELPVLPYRNIFHYKNGNSIYDGSDLNTGTQLHNKLLTLQCELQKAIDDPDLHNASKILQGCFGDDFPIINQNENVQKNNILPYSQTGTSA